PDIPPAPPELTAPSSKELHARNETVHASLAGRDYPEGHLVPGDQTTRPWPTSPEYKPYLEQLQKRPEYRTAATKAGKKGVD
ncbi:MAG: hypothetical protein ACKOTE_03910, partial [Opitutaceae bacterium]